jgi:hypothetical protein
MTFNNTKTVLLMISNMYVSLLKPFVV